MSGEADDVRRAFAAGASGYVLKTAADEQLVVSVRTVESHRAHVMTKLRAGSRAAMVRHAIAAGMLDDERAAPGA